MKPLKVFDTLAFRRPLGVDPLSPAQADAALIAQLRGELAAKELQIESLIRDVRTQANMIADFQADIDASEVQAPRRPKYVRTFDDMDAPFAEVALFCAGLRALGKEPVMEWFGHTDGRVWLNVSIEA